MPLSEHEQRLLDQMEKALYAEDPKFAASLRKSRRAQVDRMRVLLGGFGVILGLGILVAGVATSWAIIGVLGFLAMLAGAVLIYRAVTAKPGTGSTAGSRPTASSPTADKAGQSGSGGFMGRMEERWRRRRDEGDRF